MGQEARAWLSLEGLSVGDAFGERFFGRPEYVELRIESRDLPKGPWRYTDDTEMALSIVEVLRQSGVIDPDALAEKFARRADPMRGYGSSTAKILFQLQEGGDWRAVSQSAFGGSGSLGNGASMRVAPLGAFHADRPLSWIAEQATISALVTHAHDEGVAGAIAVATAAALAWQFRANRAAMKGAFLEQIRDATPPGDVRIAIDRALSLAVSTTVQEAASVLGNGSGVTAADTVPFCVWIASRHFDDFEEAMWQTVSALGDRDTNCAIVGGLVALSAGDGSVPAEWKGLREPLPIEASG
jgi:ADP-ribosylglycohydrolase